ncbi:MAG: GTP-sensing pleiotropic transcriptional regulator CodY [Clostridiales Family XIII bacterium]|jgi:transcriptional pleiotropic repressor|nr:GTP-sensing pleiotropic transcriptional regulator CodY [Clostridiales Family XIII bacterium]
MKKTTIIEKVRALNLMLQSSTSDSLSFSDLATILSELIDSNVYIVSKTGTVMGHHFTIAAEGTSLMHDPETDEEYLPDGYNEEIQKTDVTLINLKGEEMLKFFKYDYDSYDKLHMIVPIFGGRERVGTLLFARYEPAFNEEDIVLTEFGATVVGLEIKKIDAARAREEANTIKAVDKAISTLSYSEAEALKKIFGEFDGTEGLLVASKIADRSGITRSVIVNALRKLESAGIIDSRSLGMKGTYIKILNDKFPPALEKTNF